ncbi:MAG: IS5 family transposase [Bacteroidetes bacterium]|nr:MAG: IS5 family transposase [Bacteroidota bacterium]
MIKVFKRQRAYGFFDNDLRLTKLTKLGDPLVKLKEKVDFNLFKSFLMEKLLPTTQENKGGRPPYDYVTMFKILILQRYYNLSDDNIEFQINDRMTFMRFLDFTIADDIPDSRTVWFFKEKLIDLDLIEPLFLIFITHLQTLSLELKEGKIIDASFIEVPRQRNSKAENELIKKGEIPETFIQKPCKLAQKDLDATWTKKNNLTFFGYKNHVKVDKKFKIITSYLTTTACVHDSQALEKLLDSNDNGVELYADSAYTGEKQEATINSHNMVNKVHEKGVRNHPLTQDQKDSNTLKSRTRARVEHVFGFMEGSMNGMYLHSIGIKRINAAIGMMNLTYNMFRKLQLGW